MGLPGSGKSTYLKQLGLPHVSSDEIRYWLAGDPKIQTIHWRVFDTIRYLLRHRLALRMGVTYVDATHLTPRERRPYIKMGELFDCDVEALFVDVPLEICKARNRLRERVVPDEAMDIMAARMVPPTVEEGFLRVLRLTGDPAAVERYE